MNIRQDYHVHSHISPDGKSTMLQMCERALEIGLTEIVFTDHYECFSSHVRSRYFDRDYLDRYFTALEQCRNLYAGRLVIGSGVELGQSHLDETERTKVLKCPFDYVIGSVHKLGNVDLAWMNMTEKNQDLIGDSYYAMLLEMTRFGEFDCIGHLDYYKKHCARCGLDGRFERHERRIREILHIAVERGKGLEINTSGLGSVLEETMPDLPILAMYREMGGEILTAGSDAHHTKRLGYGFDAAAQKIRTAGFAGTVRFRNRTVVR